MRFLFLVCLLLPVTASAFLVRANLGDGFVDVEYDELKYYSGDSGSSVNAGYNGGYVDPDTLPPVQSGKQRHFFDGGYFEIDSSIQLQPYKQKSSGSGSIGGGLSFDDGNNALFNGIPVTSNVTYDDDGAPSRDGAKSITFDENGGVLFNGVPPNKVNFDAEGKPIYGGAGFTPSVLTYEGENTYLNGTLISTPSVTHPEKENDFTIRYDVEGNAVTDKEGRSVEDRGIVVDEDTGNISIKGVDYGKGQLEYDENGDAMVNGQPIGDRALGYDEDGNLVLNKEGGPVSYESRVAIDEDGNISIDGEQMSQDEDGYTAAQDREIAAHTEAGSNSGACAAIICLTDIEQVSSFSCGDVAKEYFDVREYKDDDGDMIFDPIKTSISRFDKLTECKEAGYDEKFFVNFMFGMMEDMPELGGDSL